MPNKRPLKAGDVVEILPEYQDAGDEAYQWRVVSNEEKGRVDIQPMGHPLQIPPIYVMQVDQLRQAIAPPKQPANRLEM